MAVRAKFRVTKIERTMGSRAVYREGEARPDYVPAEMWTVHMSPVSGNNDPNHENTKFWTASPSGSLTLGTVNKAAVDQFDLDREYYLDFTPAD